MSRTLIELCQTASQVCRVTFLTRHLFQTSGHLTERLRPTGCGVCHQCYGISHVTEILGNGDTCVNGCLTGSHRHIGRIRDQNGSFHQGLARLRVLQFRELVQNVGHLISTFSASDVNYDVGFRPLRELMLDDCLTASERSRYRSHTALCDGEEGIYNTLSCYQRHLRRKLFLVRSSAANRPLLHHGQFFVALCSLYNRYHVFYRKFSCFDLFDLSGSSNRNHDLLLYNDGLLYGTDHIARLHFIPNLYGRNKVPFQVTLQGGHFHTTLQIVPRNFHNIIQRPLDSVINAGDQARPQFYGHRNFHRLYRLSRSQSGRLLIYLNGSLISMHFNDFANQSLVADTNHVKHIRVAHTRCNNKRACDFFDYASAHLTNYLQFLYSSENRISDPTACSTVFLTPSTPAPVFPDTPGIWMIAGVVCS